VCDIEVNEGEVIAIQQIVELIAVQEAELDECLADGPVAPLLLSQQLGGLPRAEHLERNCKRTEATIAAAMLEMDLLDLCIGEVSALDAKGSEADVFLARDVECLLQLVITDDLFVQQKLPEKHLSHGLE
jgi:hypothetical protein